MKITEGSSFIPSLDAYRNVVTEQKLKMRPPIRKVTGKEPPQCASTAAIMKRRAEGKVGIDWDAPLNDWRAKESDAQPREISPDEYMAYKAMQAHGGVEGASQESSLSKETREKAVHAFTYTQPADLTPEQVLKASGTVLTPITEYKAQAKEATDAIDQELRREIRRWWIIRLSIAAACIVAMLLYWDLRLRTIEYHPGAVYKGTL